MTGRRLVSAAVLMALGALPGCASWCARNYPCQQPVCAPAACCCPAPTGPVAPACAPTSYSPPTWSQPAGGTASVPCCR